MSKEEKLEMRNEELKMKKFNTEYREMRNENL
jgi:hypothetical protein